MTPNKEFWHRAAERIDKGWTQDRYADSGNVCLAGAITLASGGMIAFGWPLLDIGARELCINALEQVRAKVGINPTMWNDMAGREKHEVVDLCRKLAEEAPL